MSKKVAYLAGAYSDTTEAGRDLNVQKAAKVAQELWIKYKIATICPHLNTYKFEGATSLGDRSWLEMFEIFLTGDFEIITRCDMIIMLPGWEKSKGACAEFVFAKWYGIPVYFYPETI